METIVLWMSVAGILVCLYTRRNEILFPLVAVFVGALCLVLGASSLTSVVLAVLVAGPPMLLQVRADLRRRFVTDKLFDLAARVLPRMSETEEVALEAGTVWFDGDLFSGRPDWSKLNAYPAFALSAEEEAFLSGPVETLCQRLDDWQIQQDRDLPDEIWQFLKEERFFGLVIPEDYGGLGFSASGHSAIVTKIATRSVAAAVTVMVPNSLGPGELLVHYGTDEQKQNYLPKLARGELIPCFALTGPEAGSDAGAMNSIGVVVEQEIDGERILGIELTFEKRYITLAPIASLIGLAFKLQDPDGLLGGDIDRGITCALLARDLPGLIIGDRHDPMGVPFANGPILGEDVFVPISSIIGGQAGVGQGWRMLMESLAAGRSISLPSMSVGAAQLSTRVAGAYATIREQFNTPIGRFEGVEELLTRIAGYTYFMDAARKMTCAAIDRGEKPAVLAGIVKAYLTEGMRKTLNDAMDLRAGAAIIQGPQNILSRAYRAIPIGITVEGSNVLTRSMIIYGQGAIRSHPYLLHEMKALQAGDKAGFDDLLWRHISHTLSNLVRALTLGLWQLFGDAPLTRGSEQKAKMSLSRLSAGFAFLSDICLATYGGTLKRREMVSGRLADALSWLYLGASCLKRYHEDGLKEAEPVFEWAWRWSAYHAHDALIQTVDNLPNGFVRLLLRFVISPFGSGFKPPRDTLVGDVAESILDGGPMREFLSRDVFVPDQNDPALGRLEEALKKSGDAVALKRKLRAAKKRGEIGANYGKALLDEAEALGIVTGAEAGTIAAYDALIADVIAVDSYSDEDYRSLR